MRRSGWSPGTARIVTPFFRKVRYLTLSMQEAEVLGDLRDQAGHLA